MAKAAYIGVDDVSRKIKKMFIGVSNDVLRKAIDTDGSVYNGKGYVRSGKRVNGPNGAVLDTATYGCTGFIPATRGATIYTKDLVLPSDDGWATVVLYDSNFNRVMHVNAQNMSTNTSYYYLDNYEALENGFKVSIADTNSVNNVRYIRLSTSQENFGAKPEIAINEPVASLAKKVKKAYVGVEGVARLFYSSEIMQPLYTGDYEIETIGDYTYMRLLTSGTLTVQESADYDLFVVGGGGYGGHGGHGLDDGEPARAGGGGGGYTNTLKNVPLAAETVLAVMIGAAHGTSSVGELVSAKGGVTGGTSGENNGGDGGSGGGAVSARRGDIDDYYASLPVSAGGSDGSNGENNSYTGGIGGYGQGTTTRAFGEADNTLYAGGGGGGADYHARGGDGGAGGGGKGGNFRTAGTANTGGGGGGGSWNGGDYCSGGAGGSGIAIIRWKV